MIRSGYAPKNESIDPFKGLKKVKWNSSMGDDKYVGDGWGNTYEIPNKGYSQLIKLRKDISVRYNFKEKCIEMLYKNEVFGSEGLKPSEWFDNPEYWANKLDDMYREEIKYMIKNMK